MKANRIMKLSEYPHRLLVCKSLIAGAVFVVVTLAATAASAAKAPGRDPAETIRPTIVVGESGVPAPPPPPSSLGEEVEKERKIPGGRNSSDLSPGLTKARKNADRKRRDRDAKEGKKRPDSSKSDEDNDEGGSGKSK
jgi:hypothetical protein